jgi:hypothetical protein
MPSAPAIAAANDEQTAEVWLALLEITHPQLTTPIRVVNNTEDVVSNGVTYLKTAFRIKLPDDSDALPSVQIEIDNVDRAVTDAARSINSPPTVTLLVVLASTPDVYEAGPFTFTMTDVNYSAETINGTMIFEDILNEPFPGESFDPARFPGLF